jgi:hypothetical protein
MESAYRKLQSLSSLLIRNLTLSVPPSLSLCLSLSVSVSVSLSQSFHSIFNIS